MENIICCKWTIWFDWLDCKKWQGVFSGNKMMVGKMRCKYFKTESASNDCVLLLIMGAFFIAMIGFKSLLLCLYLFVQLSTDITFGDEDGGDLEWFTLRCSFRLRRRTGHISPKLDEVDSRVQVVCRRIGIRSGRQAAKASITVASRWWWEKFSKPTQLTYEDVTKILRKKSRVCWNISSSRRMCF